jgi:hypothetical protein
VLRPSEGAQESFGGEVMKAAIIDGIGYGLFIACIYIVLVIGGAR